MSAGFITASSRWTPRGEHKGEKGETKETPTEGVTNPLPSTKVVDSRPPMPGGEPGEVEVAVVELWFEEGQFMKHLHVSNMGRSSITHEGKIKHPIEGSKFKITPLLIKIIAACNTPLIGIGDGLTKLGVVYAILDVGRESETWTQTFESVRESIAPGMAYAGKSLDELRQLCRDRSMRDDGESNDLANRLTAYDVKLADAVVAAERKKKFDGFVRAPREQWRGVPGDANVKFELVSGEISPEYKLKVNVDPFTLELDGKETTLAHSQVREMWASWRGLLYVRDASDGKIYKCSGGSRHHMGPKAYSTALKPDFLNLTKEEVATIPAGPAEDECVLM
jgi:hypothetical protein